MTDERVRLLLAEAQRAADYAAGVRAVHRKRTARGSRARQTDIEIAQAKLRRSMRPIRSELGRAPYGKPDGPTPLQAATLREASAIIQRERRKLWKMGDRPMRRRARRTRA